jgi:hypothetical protein
MSAVPEAAAKGIFRPRTRTAIGMAITIEMAIEIPTIWT